MMRQLFIVLLACVFIPLSADARLRCDKAACDAVKEDIRNIEAQMRQGYTRAKGEKYEARLRKLKTKRKQLCR
jgi:hypothetical protein